MASIVAGVIAKTGVLSLDLDQEAAVGAKFHKSALCGRHDTCVRKERVERRKSIVRAEGWTGLYRGLHVGLIKSAPASAIILWTYENALGRMKDYEGDEA